MAAAAMLSAPALAAVLRWGAAAAAAAWLAALPSLRPAAIAAQALAPAPPAPAVSHEENAEERDYAYDDLDHPVAAGFLGLIKNRPGSTTWLRWSQHWMAPPARRHPNPLGDSSWRGTSARMPNQRQILKPRPLHV
ncbi:unnamed protein product [Prorocentrum cordatum]|uniref:Uncharacterized protein n=1 Tax=Prorocentrum cordatum TaxID=2364126 RepID=A0ABN9SXM8_9DINO|nr:unnamed protein product [Polarella glacialis]